MFAKLEAPPQVLFGVRECTSVEADVSKSKRFNCRFLLNLGIYGLYFISVALVDNSSISYAVILTTLTIVTNVMFAHAV